MPKTLDFRETRNAYSQGLMIHRRNRHLPVDQPASVDSLKDIHRQVAQLRSAAAFQQNWSRIIRHEVEIAANHLGANFRGVQLRRASLSHSAHGLQISDWTEPQPAEPLAVNPDQFVAYITSGGRKAVIRMLRTLRNTAVHGEAVRVITEAITELIQSDPPSRSNLADAEIPRRESFIQRAQRLDEQRRVDAALDLIYDSIDEMLRSGQFFELDSLLVRLPTNELSADMLLGVLTATLPARSRLSNRSAFFLRRGSEPKRSWGF